LTDGAIPNGQRTNSNMGTFTAFEG
jgi:hypothetical protein